MRTTNTKENEMAKTTKNATTVTQTPSAPKTCDAGTGRPVRSHGRRDQGIASHGVNMKVSQRVHFRLVECKSQLVQNGDLAASATMTDVLEAIISISNIIGQE